MPSLCMTFTTFSDLSKQVAVKINGLSATRPRKLREIAEHDDNI